MCGELVNPQVGFDQKQFIEMTEELKEKDKHVMRKLPLLLKEYYECVKILHEFTDDEKNGFLNLEEFNKLFNSEVCFKNNTRIAK